jgi:hypothetical protein
MGKTRPTGKCKLCLNERLLCDSHYLPKRSYEFARAPELKNPNPVMSVNGQLKQISDQYRGCVLCEDCEDRFSKRGEKWVLANVLDGSGGAFPLQDALGPMKPVASGPDCDRYNVTNESAFDLNKLMYFGISVFWRGAAHNWKTSTGQVAPPVSMPGCDEQLRQFLLDEGPLPNNALLMVDVWAYKPAIPMIYPVLTEQLSDTCTRYWFYFMGLCYFLFVGTDIPTDAQQSALANGVITVDLGSTKHFLGFFKDLLKAQTKGPKIDEMFKQIALIKAKKL